MEKALSETNVFDFTNGATIGDADVASWVKDVVNTLQNSEGNTAVKSSGKAIVIAQKVTYSHDPDNPVIVVYEIKNGYKRHIIPQTKN